MIYLKTYFYRPYELSFIKMHLNEGGNYFDKIILCEFNRTHVGQHRDFIFEKHKNIFSLDELDKIEYFPCDISQEIIVALNNENLAHNINEPLMRGYFAKIKKFNDEDIIISVDADEIIYESSYDKIINMTKEKSVVLLKMHQFFYKMNYYWHNNVFVAPTSATYSYFKNKYPCNLRYMGDLLDEFVGCHFSWCMSPEEMIYKLNSYAHTKYRFCADLDLLRDAINNKKYPFDKSVDFKIQELSFDDPILPKSIKKVFNNV